MTQTNVQRRKAGYYYRQKIPADLFIHYGKREIVRSLGTSKKREACAAGYEQGHSWTRDFARIRAGAAYCSTSMARLSSRRLPIS